MINLYRQNESTLQTNLVSLKAKKISTDCLRNIYCRTSCASSLTHIDITMLSKKANIYELFCLVHGDPEDFAFGIKINKSEKVDELKKAILPLKGNTFAGIDHNNLKLYNVNISLTSTNTQRSSLGDRNVNIVNTLGGQLMLPIIKLENVFTTPPADGYIHVIVEVSASLASTGK